MRIVIRQTDNKDFALCGGIDASEFTEGITLDGVEGVEPAEYLRAARAAPQPRGNTKTTVSFTVTREHADFRSCEDYMLKHHALIPKTGTLLFISEGSGKGTYRLTDAALLRHNSRPIGVSSIHRYDFLGGDFLEGAA